MSERSSRARRGEVTPEDRTRILSCTDRKTLDQWLDQATLVEHVDERFR